ncbi:MAG: NAD(+)/NADH kinase [Sutterella parvirubra]|nr:NAD(+)/NADH kinase [Sutterella parvirubra]
MPLYKNVAVFVKPTESLTVPLTVLIEVLEKAGAEVYLDERSAETLGSRAPSRGHTRDELGALCDLAVVLGGDGTMLGVARSLAPYRRPIIGINAGRLGFITDIVFDEVREVLPAVLEGRCTSDVRRLLKGEIIRDGKVLYRNVAVNDIGVTHGRAGGMVDFVIDVNGQQMSSQSADGIICSTATGSTAYALASGGPILHPSLDGMVLVPVAPHTLSSRPIVLPAGLTVTIEVTDARDAQAYFDMQEFFDMKPGDLIRIRMAEETLEMLHPQGFDYFDLLRRKLKWNFMPTSVRRQASGGE